MLLLGARAQSVKAGKPGYGMESYYKQNKKLITDILDILEGHFGKNVEFVVHDLSLDYEHTIVDIRNGEVTGRKVGRHGRSAGPACAAL